jgi:hypothetical protein
VFFSKMAFRVVSKKISPGGSLLVDESSDISGLNCTSLTPRNQIAAA